MPTLAPTVHRRPARCVNLWDALSPPQVTVGDERLEPLAFALDGWSLRGVLARRPASLDVVVDYGFARAELRG